MPVEHLGEDVRVQWSGRLDADVAIPGSKSLTNRYLACAALADGETTLANASLSDDAYAMIAGVRELGIQVGVDPAAARVRVIGAGGRFTNLDASIDVGHAGTAMRFLVALSAAGFGITRLDGSPRMRERPISDLVDGLRQIGVKVAYEAREGYPPLVVHAEGLSGGEIVLDSPPSSQFISALLMAAPAARSDVMLRIEGTLVSEPYIAMTLDVMRRMGVEVLEADGRRFIIAAPQRYTAGHFTVEADASAATYFWAAAAITGGRARVVGLGPGSSQGDSRFVDVLAQMGCTVSDDAHGTTVVGPPDGALRGIAVDLNAMPDTVQTLAVAALFANGPTSISNVANLRIKETDRLTALATELNRLGARVDVRSDGLTIHPPEKLLPATIATYDDHRMAMSFALAGLRGSTVTLRDADVVSKSFPGYFDTLARALSDSEELA